MPLQGIGPKAGQELLGSPVNLIGYMGLCKRGLRSRPADAATKSLRETDIPEWHRRELEVPKVDF